MGWRDGVGGKKGKESSPVKKDQGQEARKKTATSSTNAAAGSFPIRGGPESNSRGE